MNDQSIDWERLERSILGEGAPEERAALERWIAADPTRRVLADAMRAIGSGRPVDSRWDAQKALRQVQRRLGTRRLPTRLPRLGCIDASRMGREIERAVVAIAAAAVFAVMVVSSWHPSSVAGRTTQESRDVVTGPGQRAWLDLGDGTRVVLSPESHIRIPASLGANARGRRQVWLEGEAFFAVVHDTGRAFIVRTPHGSAEDIGTEFVVNTYPEMRGMRVAVRDGSVAVRPRRDSVQGTTTTKTLMPADSIATLHKGDVARVAKTGAVAVSRHQDVGLFFAGVEGALVLRATPLRDAIPRLERWYGIRIQVRDDALLARRVSVSFRDESTTEAIGIIALALQSKANWQQNRVTLVSDLTRGDNQ